MIIKNHCKPPLFGMPFVLSFISIHTKKKFINMFMNDYIFGWDEYLPKPPKISTKQQPQEIENEMKTYETDWNQILHKQCHLLRLIDPLSINGGSGFDSIYPEEIPVNDTIFENLNPKSKHIDIIIEWKSQSIYERIKKVMNKVIVDPEYSKWKKERNDNDNLVTIYDCIDSYTSKRRPSSSSLNHLEGGLGYGQLGGNGLNDGFPDIAQIQHAHAHNLKDGNYNDSYYCSRCRKMQKSTKKLDLCTFPKYLIIHLQRDGINGGKYVDAPLEGLNLFDIELKIRKSSDNILLMMKSKHKNNKTENDDHSPFVIDGSNYNDDGYYYAAPIYNLYGCNKYN